MSIDSEVYFSPPFKNQHDLLTFILDFLKITQWFYENTTCNSFHILYGIYLVIYNELILLDFHQVLFCGEWGLGRAGNLRKCVLYQKALHVLGKSPAS